MSRTIINLFLALMIIMFIIFINVFYFSEKNKTKTAKYRIFYYDHVTDLFNQLPFLANDTQNIIDYKNDLENSKKKKPKRKFWELLSR